MQMFMGDYFRFSSNVVAVRLAYLERNPRLLGKFCCEKRSPERSLMKVFVAKFALGH